jgi:hypothetical protein
MEFRAPSLLGKRPRGYVPDDLMPRARGERDGSDGEEEGARGAPQTATELAVAAALHAEAARKAEKGGDGAKKGKTVTFAEPAAEDDAECAAIKEVRRRRRCKRLLAAARTRARLTRAPPPPPRARWKRRLPSARSSGAAPKARTAAHAHANLASLNCAPLTRAPAARRHRRPGHAGGDWRRGGARGAGGRRGRGRV